VFDSLGIPAWDDAAIGWVHDLGAVVGNHLDLLVTEEVAKTLWTSWNPEQPSRIEDRAFRKAFTNILAEGVRLGFNVNRFRDIARSLPDPIDEGSNWTPLFEAAIAGQDRCKVRISFSPDRYRTYMSTNQAKEKETSWDGMLSMMRDGLFYELGIVYPPIAVAADESLTGEYFRVEWNDVQLPPQQGIRDNQALVNDTVDRLSLLNIQGEKAVNPANGAECALIPIEHADIAEQAGLTTWNQQGFAILAISAVLRKAAGAFVNRYFVWYCLNALAQVWPILVGQVKEQVDIDVLVRIIRGLADEEISFRNLRSILEAILSAQSRIDVDFSKYIVFSHHASGVTIGPTLGDYHKTVPDHLANVRNALRRYISHKYTRGGNTLVVYLVGPEIEVRLRNPKELFPEERQALLTVVRNEVDNLPPTAQNPVILTTQEIRLRLRKEVAHEFPHLNVLSYQELSPDMNIQPIGRISSDDWPNYSRDSL
jgi:flagellar biosynthesis component FlhA